MKPRTPKLRKRLSLLLLPLLFAACTEEIAEEATVEKPATGLSICATKATFTNSEEPQTRLSTSDYLTTFTDGDQIGVIITSKSGDGSVLYEYNNICYTYQGATRRWVTKSSNPPIYDDADVAYIAYYPYDEKMNGKLTINEIISSFTPQADQSTFEGYSHSDLMTAAGVLDSNARTLTFDFTHRMSLYEFHLTGKTYKTITNGYEYSLPIEDGKGTISATIDGATKTKLYYNSKDDTYCLLTKPDLSVAYTVSITSAGTTYTIENQPLTTTLTSGSYKR